MRIFLLFSLLISAQVFGQADPGDGTTGPCTGATITSGLAVYNCTTLTISAGTYNFPPSPAPVVRVKVQGAVTIASGVVLNLSGEDGVADATENQAGALGGAGADDGGGNIAGPTDPAAGGATQGGSSISCGGGGGGGGFTDVGDNGSLCVGSAGGTGGATHDISVLFRGGFGGAPGGLGEFFNPFETGTGGGGGGAIWISAGGDITMNGSIDVSGGKGGPGISDSGGGGGGSGGAIRIQSLGSITNNAIFNFAGGTGGAGDAPGARGGDGSVGVYEFEDADNVIQGVGTGAIGNGADSSETFHSSISCGAVKMKDDQDLLFQMAFGFGLIVLISRIRGRFRRSA